MKKVAQLIQLFRLLFLDIKQNIFSKNFTCGDAAKMKVSRCEVGNGSAGLGLSEGSVSR